MSQERIDEYKRLEAAIAEAHQRLRAFKASWADECDVKVGDTLEVNGYAHTGKKFIVDRVSVERSFFGRYELVAFGRVLKKDGTPGTGEGEHRKEIAR